MPTACVSRADGLPCPSLGNNGVLTTERPFIAREHPPTRRTRCGDVTARRGDADASGPNPHTKLTQFRSTCLRDTGPDDRRASLGCRCGSFCLASRSRQDGATRPRTRRLSPPACPMRAATAPAGFVLHAGVSGVLSPPCRPGPLESQNLDPWPTAGRLAASLSPHVRPLVPCSPQTAPSPLAAVAHTENRSEPAQRRGFLPFDA